MAPIAMQENFTSASMMAKAVLAPAPMGAYCDCLWSAAVSVQVVEEKAARTPGKKSLAIEAYARALRSIPGTICDNAGELLPSSPCYGQWPIWAGPPTAAFD